MAEGSAGERIRIPLDLAVRRALTNAGFTVRSQGTTRRVVELFDTSDRRLAAAGAELSFETSRGWRWRRDPLGHPRLPVREWTAPPDADMALLASWSRAYRRGQPLGRRATVQLLRRRHEVIGADLAHPVEVIEERVDADRPAGWQPAIRRVTVGPVDGGSPDPVRAVFEEVALPPGEALALLSPRLVRAPKLVVPSAAATGPRDLLMRSLTLAMVQWMHFDCELAGPGSPDSLRKLRIAARRMRTDLQTFAPLLDTGWVEALRERLGTLTSRLGTVRDAEVLAERLTQLAALLPPEDREAANPLLDLAATHLARLREEMAAELAGEAYTELVDSAVAAVTRPRWSDSTDPLASATPLAARRWRRLRRFVASLDEAPSNEQLHRVRILAKRVRYAVEASVPAAGARATASATRVIALQTVLGEQHDAVVTREWLRQHATGGGPLAFAAGELAALELGRERAATAQWREVWAEVAKRKGWRWLRG